MSVDDISSSQKGKASSDAKQAGWSRVHMFILFVLSASDSGFTIQTTLFIFEGVFTQYKYTDPQPPVIHQFTASVTASRRNQEQDTNTNQSIKWVRTAEKT